MKPGAGRALELTDRKSLLALRDVGPESEAESVRFRGCRVTRVGPEVNTGRTILSWPSGLCELSFSSCDNRKSHPRANGRKTPTAPAACRSSFRLAHNARCHGRRLPAGHMGGNQGVVFLPPSISNPLKADWQRHVHASSGYLELGMFDDAASGSGRDRRQRIRPASRF